MYLCYVMLMDDYIIMKRYLIFTHNKIKSLYNGGRKGLSLGEVEGEKIMTAHYSSSQDRTELEILCVAQP